MKNKIVSIWQYTAMRYIIYTLAVIVPLWYGSGHLFPFTTAKSLLVILGGVLVGGLYLWGKSQESDTVIRYNWMQGIMALFVVSLTISAVSGVDTQLSFFGSLIDGTGLNVLFASIMIALGVVHLVRTDKNFIPTFTGITLATAFAVAIGAFFPEAFPTTSGGSTFGNTSYMAAYFLVTIFLGLAIMVSKTDRWKKILTAVPLVTLLFAPTFFNRLLWTGQVSWADAFANPLLFAGVSNGASIALVVSMGVFIGLTIAFQARKKVFKIIGGMIAGVAILGMVGFWAMFQTPGNAVNDYFVVKKTTNRLLFWDIAKEGIADRPLFGWGMNNYAYVFQDKFKTEFFSKNNIPELWTNNPHNMVYEYGVNQGIIGLVLYLLITLGAIFIAFRRALRDRDQSPWMIAIIAGLVGYFIQNLFIFDTPGTFFIFWVIIGMAVGSSSAWKNYRVPEKYQHVYRASLKVVAIMIILLLPMIFFKPWKESKAWVEYTRISNISTQEVSPQGISRLGYASDTSYIAGRMIDIVRSELQNKITQEQQGILLNIVRLMKKNLANEMVTAPDNFRAYWTLAQLDVTNIMIAGKIDPELAESANMYFDKAHMMNPENIFVLLDKAQLATMLGDFDKARDLVIQSIELAPEYGQNYTIADSLNEISPDKDFGNKIKELKVKNEIE